MTHAVKGWLIYISTLAWQAGPGDYFKQIQICFPIRIFQLEFYKVDFLVDSLAAPGL